MPSQRKRIGFLPSQEVHEIIEKLCKNSDYSQSKVTGLLVEERTFGDAHSSAYRLAPFSGSFQEIRYYFHKSGSYEILSHVGVLQ